MVVCHNGAQWLPETLDSLASQSRRPDRLVAVDLASSDDTARIIVERHGQDTLISLDENSSFGEAAQAGLDAFTPSRRPAPTGNAPDEAVPAGPVEWVWLLHDDSAPSVDALNELLVRVTLSPSVWMVGPKIRDWAGERLVQAGLTIDAVGHVDAGVDSGEPDQGQGDDVDEVLAVSSAGALVRRDIWDRLGGMDPAWTAYGDEVDLGWRVNAAGGRVVVAPRAVVRHVGGGCAGRSADLGVSAEATRRRNGMQIVLSNTAGALVPLLVVRYLLGGLLRSLIMLLVARQPTRAAAELVGVGRVVVTPQVVATGRRERDGNREVSHGDLRRLFPAAGSQWRNSMLVSRLSTDLTTSRRNRVAVETGPVSEEAESLGNELSVLGAFVRRPASLLLILMSLLALIAERHLLSSTIHGGRLLAAPGGASDLWSTYFASWHPSGVGSTTPAPTSLALLATLSTLLLGKAWLALDILVLGVVPLAALSAFTAMRAVTATVRIRVWVAVAYALLPAVTGAVAGGRLDVIIAAIVLPRITRSAALALSTTAEGTSRGRCVRGGLWLAVGAAFAPLLWVLAAVGLAIAVAMTRAGARRAGAVLAIPLLLLVPWTWHVVAHPGLLISGTGLPEFYTSHSAPSGIALALLRAGGAAQPPIWIGIPLLGAAVLGLQRASRIAIARGAMAFLIIGIAIAVAETRSAGVVDGVAASRHWPGLALLVAGAAALLAGLVAAVGARPALSDRSFGWRQPAAVGVVVLALAATGALGVGWVIRGAGRPLSGDDPALLPLFTQAEMTAPTTPRALVINASRSDISYALIRRPTGLQLGDGETLPTLGGASGVAAQHLAAAVRNLVAGTPGAGAGLVPFGIDYVVAPSGGAHRVASALGRASTLTVVPAPGATVWQSSLRTGELTVLSGPSVATAVAGTVPATAPAAVLPATSDGATAHLAAAGGVRLAVMAEPAGPQWHASFNGTSLPRTMAYGWAQAFVLPSTAGTLRVSIGHGSRPVWLWLELLAAIAVIGVGLAAPPQRGRRVVL